jgi:type I restriction enzyme, S subunit
MELSEAPVMEPLKRGYKKTEMGLVPEMWGIESLGTLCDVRDGTHESPQFFANGVPFVTSKNIVNGRLDLDNVSYISKDDAIEFDKRSKVDRNDILMSMIGTIGSAVMIECEPDFCIKNVALLKPRKVTPAYLVQLINSPVFQRYLGENLDGGIQKFVSLGTLRQLAIPVPPLPEQHAIATALSDVDALLGSLDALIAKKKAIKQGAMQQLLMGKQRLPGFRGEWEVKRLGEIFRLHAAGSKSQYIRAGGRYFIVDMGSVTIDGKLACSKPTDYEGDFLKRGDLVMPKDDIGGGNIIGKAAYIDADRRYVQGDHVYALTTLEGDPLFLSFMINSWAINGALRKKVGGSAQLSLGRKSVEEQEIPYPQPEEQTAIATVLSDMDAEISALEARRAKTALLKQGMMQELLTGRTRFV